MSEQQRTATSSQAPSRIPGDQVTVSISVKVPQAEAFRLFTEEIDRWWRGGLKYRVGGKHRSVIHLEPRLGGRLFESFQRGSEERGEQAHILETGRVTVWEPPHRLVLEWRAVNFAPEETTEVEVLFAAGTGEAGAAATLVTVKHRGWASIRADHPVRHGQEVPVFMRHMGLWWGELMSSLRELAVENQQKE